MTSVGSDGTAMKPRSKRTVVTIVDDQQENTTVSQTPPPPPTPPQSSNEENSHQQLNSSEEGVSGAQTGVALPDCPLVLLRLAIFNQSLLTIRLKFRLVLI